MEVQNRRMRGNWRGWSAENSQQIQGKMFSAHVRKQEQDCFMRGDELGAKGDMSTDSALTDQGTVQQPLTRVGRAWRW